MTTRQEWELLLAVVFCGLLTAGVWALVSMDTLIPAGRRAVAYAAAEFPEGINWDIAVPVLLGLAALRGVLDSLRRY